MDDLVTTTNSNSSSNSNSSTTSSNNGLSYYELALKKLNHILKSKANDAGKQLEELWDSINKVASNGSATTTNNNGPKLVASMLAKSTTSNSIPNGKPAVVQARVLSPPITSSDSSTNEATNNNALKRDASKLSSSSLSSTSESSLAKKTKIQIEKGAKPFAQKTLMSNQKTSQIKLQQKSAQIDALDTHSSSSSSSSISNSSKISSPPLITTFSNGVKDVEFNLLSGNGNGVVDMLEFSCCLCNQFNQELNNKLIECKKCTKLFHQMCHVPNIENKDIEASSSGDRLAECSSCKSLLKSPPLSTSSSLSNSQQKIYPYEEECTRMDIEATNENHINNKISVNLNSKNINNKFIEISNSSITNKNNNNKLINDAGVNPENLVNNNSNSIQPPTNQQQTTETESIANNTHASNLNGNTAKFFKREFPKADSKETIKSNASNNPSSNETISTNSPSQETLHLKNTTFVNNNNNNGPKGFAALANKFNSNSISGSGMAKTPGSSLPMSNGKVNHDDLFKKFRQSVNTNSTNSSSSTNSNKVPTNTEKPPQTSATASSLTTNKPVINNSTSNNNNTIQQKRNIFNSQNSLSNANETVKKSNLVNTVKL